MSQRIATEARGRGQQHAAARFEEWAEKTKEQASLIRQALANRALNTTEDAV